MTAQQSSAASGKIERVVESEEGPLFVVDRAGREPAIVMMHGFPDDHRIYDRLARKLRPQRAVAFDWFGYGRSGRGESMWSDSLAHQGQIAHVLDALELDRAVLVAHDASGPDAIEFALANPDRVTNLILLNTYYGHAPSQRFPEMIRLFADDQFAPLAEAMIHDQDQRLWLLQHTARRWGIDPLDPNGIGFVSVLPQFFGDDQQPDALDAVRAWTGSLFASLDRQDVVIARGELLALESPVRLCFGARDRYLSPDVAEHLSSLFRDASSYPVADASHWAMWDNPEALAGLIGEVVQ
jgi:pimeloyl-ACP methyl ester carboxylesterase